MCDPETVQFPDPLFENLKTMKAELSACLDNFLMPSNAIVSILIYVSYGIQRL